MRRTRSLVSRLMEGLSLQVRDTVEGETPAAPYPALPKGVPLRADFPRPGEDVTVGDKRGNLARERLRGRPSRENGLPERPQTIRQSEIIKFSSAEDAQSSAARSSDHFFFSCSSSPSRGVM